MAVISSHNLFSTFTRFNSSSRINPHSQTTNSARLIRIRCSGDLSTCATNTVENQQRVKLSNGNDSLEICRVLNGMWQTSGGWGRIDRDDAVEAMLRYADSGLSTFDMADHCM
ncbi:NAD(P)-linked oxidoreductase superfamily protein, putative [Medicago truncatula]|uniref:NAD(P)-linked oxidoreductase superfamily protein, putative n=1 Tax=Medicago truncatula TaxID=3880 RepID=A0A072VLF3_MEDTR|nr:NAD(P)-linked oxidoreductase superfamily protein, putative [Medicago truncatula]